MARQASLVSAGSAAAAHVLSSDGAALVWAIDTATNKPLAGAIATLYDWGCYACSPSDIRTAATATTDGSGVAALPPPRAALRNRRALLVEAPSGETLLLPSLPSRGRSSARRWRLPSSDALVQRVSAFRQVRAARRGAAQRPPLGQSRLQGWRPSPPARLRAARGARHARLASHAAAPPHLMKEPGFFLSFFCKILGGGRRGRELRPAVAVLYGAAARGQPAGEGCGRLAPQPLHRRRGAGVFVRKG